jgi:uroporphyrinogen-III synthase
MDATLLLTRPIDGATLFAELARQSGWTGRIQISPQQRIELLPPEPMAADRAGTLVFTSQYGVASFVAGIAARHWPVYAVGPRTAQAACDAGFQDIRTPAGGDAAALLAALRAERPLTPILHLHGRNIAQPVAALLNADGIPAFSMMVYDQKALPLDVTATTLLQGEGPVVIPLFSPRSARLLLESVTNHRAPITLIAISHACATVLQPFVDVNPTCNLVLSPQPDSHGMRQALMQVQRDLEAGENPR